MNQTVSGGRDRCELCGKGSYDGATEAASVASNVRAWKTHTSTIWRCPFCRSLHQFDRMDLAPFYQDYPYKNRKLDGFTRRVYSGYVKRLEAFGISAESPVLDYGGGDGIFIQYLHEAGFNHAFAYDPYSDSYGDPAVLERAYDLVVCQDVIEHVEDPRCLMATVSRLLAPGGLLCIGTPRADGIDLFDPVPTIHSLHVPAHLHILSERALLDLLKEKDLTVEGVFAKHSCDTHFPFVNWRFLRAYLASVDDTLDAGFEDVRMANILLSPKLWYLGLFGGFGRCDSEMIVIARR